MALSEIDRTLLQRCLARKPRAWEDFVDRFLGLVVHVIRHSSQCRSIRLGQADVDDLAAEAFLALISDDFAVLRRFRGDSSLATYLTVVTRRVVVRELLKHKKTASLHELSENSIPATAVSSPEERISNREEVERLLRHLHGQEADVVRLYHLEGKTYREISDRIGMPENSIGPTLSRARQRIREVGSNGS